MATLLEWIPGQVMVMTKANTCNAQVACAGPDASIQH